MCGIVGAIAERKILKILLEGLKRLEYRGYDSAGVALLKNNKILRAREQGKVAALIDQLKANPIDSNLGIAHTRWATHGIPSQKNAHPHFSANETIALVHNGIIENYQELRENLIKQKIKLTSDTDTEVIAHLLEIAYKKHKNMKDALAHVLKEIEGAYALAILNVNEPDKLYGVRSGSPLVVGLGIGENFLASDSLSLVPVTNRFIYLEEDDFVCLTKDKVEIYNKKGKSVKRDVNEVEDHFKNIGKGDFKHFMLKEIFEQPQVVARTLEKGIDHKNNVIANSFGAAACDILPKVENIKIVACGTSYHAGLTAKYWLEDIAGIACDVEIASELRYRTSVVKPNTLMIVISQSGETADTLAALRNSKNNTNYLARLAICNVPNSAVVRESELVFLTQAGPEIGVASTKAFTTQLTTLLLFTILMAQLKGHNVKQLLKISKELRELPGLLNKVLELDVNIKKMAKCFADKHHALFLGRGVFYPAALEGALKLKEISYIHAEAYPAGELKHGPLALVDEDMPVVAVVANDDLLEKVKSNLEEVQSRKGKLYLITEKSLKSNLSLVGDYVHLPDIPRIIAPIVYAIPLQLLAYHVAVIKGTDVDQPRNLAKSVTVE